MTDKPDPTLGPVDGFGNLPDDIEAPPVVQIVKAVGIGSHEAGEFVRLTVETLTQGEIVLHAELAMVTELINMLTAARNQAEKLQATAKGTATRAVTAVQSFAVGDCPEMPGAVMLAINHGASSEQMFVIPNSQGARDLAMSLAKSADDATRRSKGILPVPGMNGHGARLLGPSGMPLA